MSVIGWGQTYYPKYLTSSALNESTNSDVLKLARVEVIDNEDCRNYYPFMDGEKKVHGGWVSLIKEKLRLNKLKLGKLNFQKAGMDVVCTKEYDRGGRAMVGDNGGPLMMMNNSDNVWTLVGVVSYQVPRGKLVKLQIVFNSIVT